MDLQDEIQDALSMKSPKVIVKTVTKKKHTPKALIERAEQAEFNYRRAMWFIRRCGLSRDFGRLKSTYKEKE